MKKIFDIYTTTKTHLTSVVLVIVCVVFIHMGIEEYFFERRTVPFPTTPGTIQKGTFEKRDFNDFDDYCVIFTYRYTFRSRDYSYNKYSAETGNICMKEKPDAIKAAGARGPGSRYITVLKTRGYHICTYRKRVHGHS